MSTRKPPVTSQEEKFYLSVGSDELEHEVTYGDFTFIMQIPPLIEEAGLSLSAISLAQNILRNPEYKHLVENLKIPEIDPEAEETTIIEKPVDLNRIQQVKYALTLLPDDFTAVINNMAYLNIVVKDILYKDKPLWVQVDGEDIRIDSFRLFAEYIRKRSIRFVQL